MILTTLNMGISSHYYIMYTGYGVYYGDRDGIICEIAKMLSPLHHPASPDSFMIKKFDRRTLRLIDVSDSDILRLTQHAIEKLSGDGLNDRQI